MSVMSVVPGSLSEVITGTTGTDAAMPPRDHEHRVRNALHHPWRVFSHLSEWKLLWGHNPGGELGVTDYDDQTVTLSPLMSQAQRRCTIAHETQHILRGPWTQRGEREEERSIDRHVARLLLPDVRQVGDALAWVGWRDVKAAAAELWVDRATLQTRLDAMHPSEKAYLRRRFEDWRHH